MTAGIPGRIVVATWRADLADGNDRLLLLVAWLRRRGADVELVTMGDGPALERFRATAPTLVVDELRRTGVAAVPDALGLGAASTGLKTLRLRRWLHSRRDATFYLHHPAAAALVRHLRGGPPDLVASLPDPTWTLDGIVAADLVTLSGARAWVVATPTQREEVHRRLQVPVEELGAVVDPDALPRVDDPRPGRGVVTLVTAADPWNAADPAVEILWQLRRARPTVGLRWLVPDERAAWLAHHDLQHAGLSGVDVRTLEDPGALARVGIVVRTVDEPVGEAPMVAAALAGLPVLDRHGAYGDDLDEGPVDVEALVRAVIEVRDHPEAARAEGPARAARLAHLDLDVRAEAVLELLRR